MTTDSWIGPVLSAVIVGIGWATSRGAKDQTIKDLKSRDEERHRAELVEVAAKTETAASVRELREDFRELKALGSQIPTLAMAIETAKREMDHHRETHRDSIQPQLARIDAVITDHERRLQVVESHQQRRRTSDHAQGGE